MARYTRDRDYAVLVYLTLCLGATSLASHSKTSCNSLLFGNRVSNYELDEQKDVD